MSAKVPVEGSFHGAGVGGSALGPAVVKVDACDTVGVAHVGLEHVFEDLRSKVCAAIVVCRRRTPAQQQDGPNERGAELLQECVLSAVDTLQKPAPLGAVRPVLRLRFDR